MQIHLKTPVEISVNGQTEKSEFLNIDAPNRGNIIDVAKLQEIGSSALMAAQSMFQGNKQEAPADTEAKFDAQAALMMLKVGGKFQEAIGAFDTFLLKYGKFDEVKVQTGSLSRLDIKDYENALGSYFAEHCFFDFTQA